MQGHPRYTITEKIDAGDFATVYRGHDAELNREVAIKQIHDQYLGDPQLLDRYWREAQLMANLEHPRIMSIYDIVRERGWLILELMLGSIKQLLNNTTFYIFPRVNPDASESFFQQPLRERTLNAHPLDLDKDGHSDEDGF